VLKFLLKSHGWAILIEDLQGIREDSKWVAEPRMLSLCKVARSTLQSWERAGLVARSESGAYGEGDVLEATLLLVLREYFPLDELAERWTNLRTAGAAADFISRARGLGRGDRFDLVIEPDNGGIRVADNDAALIDAVRHPEVPRAVVVLPLADRLRFIRDSFRDIATTAKRPTQRRAGRPRRRAEVRPLRGS
jgi:DNA-binding transcriptional MerR regulator